MTDLRIIYKGKSYHWYLPACWDEVTDKDMAWITPKLQDWKKQYLAWVDAMEEGKADMAKVYDALLQKSRIYILKKLCGISRIPWSRTARAFYSMLPDEVADVLLQLNFIFTDLDRQLPTPYLFKHKGKYYHNPGKDFQLITGGEFHFADKYYASYLEHGRLEDLDQLVAILYRQRGKGPEHQPGHEKYCGDLRRPFNKNRIELDAATLATLPLSTKVTIFFWWQCFRQQLQLSWKDIFSQERTKKAQKGNGWIPIFRTLSKHPLQFEAVAELKLSLLLMELRESMREAKEMERKLKNKKP